MNTKTIFIGIALLTLSFIASSQERIDTIYFLSSGPEGVNIMINHEDKVEYTYPGEKSINITGKNKIHKIVFSSGRVEMCTTINPKATKPTYNPYIERMDQLKKKRSSGNYAILGKSHVNRLSCSVVFADTVANMIEGPIETVKKRCVEEFGKGAECKKSLVFGDRNDGFHAVLTIAKADYNDGEVYGYLEYYKDNEDKPFYSFYFNGETNSRSDSFDERMLSAIHGAGNFSEMLVYTTKEDRRAFFEK